MEDNKMKIEKSIYDGYIWYSDKSEPEVFQSQDFEFDTDEIVNPFIIEGQLYDAQKMFSYSIKFVDGKYICKKYQVESTDFNKSDVEIKTFHANRMDEKKMRYLQYWKEEDDELCEGMKVLQPKELVFVGFVKE